MADCKNNADYTADSEKYMSNCNHSSEDWVFSVGGSTVTKKVVTDDIYFEGITDVTINQGADFDPTEGVSAHDGNGNELPFEVVPPELTDPCEIGEHDFEYKAYMETHPLLPTWCNSDKRAIYVPPCNMVAKIVHRIVTVVQSALPTFSGLVKAVLNVGQSFDPMSGVSATDGNGNPIEDITYSGTYDDEAKGKIASFETEFAQNAKVVETSFEPIQDGTPWMSDTIETEPYNYRRTADGEIEHSFNSEYDEIVGASVGWNQLFNGMTRSTADGITTEYDATTHKISITNDSRTSNYSSGSNRNNATQNLIVGHKYVYITIPQVEGVVVSNGGNTAPYIFQATQTAMYLRVTKDYDFVTAHPIGNVTSLYLNIIDLTLFNSAIADYVYTLEQSTAGSGVTWLKSHFPRLFDNGYQPYDSGSIKSVGGLTAHEMVGFNQWDEEWELGDLSTSTGAETSASDRIRSTNYIPALPSTTYYCSGYNGTSGVYAMYYYDDNQDFISFFVLADGNGTFTTPSNCHYMRFRNYVAYGTTYKNDICINLSDTSINGQYFPYEKHTYPLDSSVTLRGRYVLDNGQLYAVGDVYEADGTPNRKYAEISLGDLNWAYTTTDATSPVPYFQTPSLASTIKYGATLVCSKYASTGGGRNTLADKTIAMYNMTSSTTMCIADSAYTDATSFAQHLTDIGAKLVYELATPTTETATPYDNPQWCDSKGTEEYVGSELPVGHNTRYADIYPISGWTDVEVTKTGVNVWDEEWELGGYDANGNKTAGTSRVRSKNRIPCTPSTTYYFACAGSYTNWITFCQFDADGNSLGLQSINHVNNVFTTHEDAHSFCFFTSDGYGATYNNDISINYPSTDHDYHAYQGATYTENFGQTVYGGTIDLVSGTLTVTMAEADLGSLNYSDNGSTATVHQIALLTLPKANGYDNFSCTNYETKPSANVGTAWGRATTSAIIFNAPLGMSVSEFKENVSGQKIVYELATPQTYQLTRHQISLFLGQNDVLSDTNGETRVVFMKNLPQSGSVTYPLAGTYEITYEAEDQCGNVGTATREVEVIAS